MEGSERRNGGSEVKSDEEFKAREEGELHEYDEDEQEEEGEVEVEKAEESEGEDEDDGTVLEAGAVDDVEETPRDVRVGLVRVAAKVLNVDVEEEDDDEEDDEEDDDDGEEERGASACAGTGLGSEKGARCWCTTSGAGTETGRLGMVCTWWCESDKERCMELEDREELRWGDGVRLDLVREDIQERHGKGGKARRVRNTIKIGVSIERLEGMALLSSAFKC